jgi:mRNA-degrading endonuclease RelE of RelBE toxin-antitoxin system
MKSSVTKTFRKRLNDLPVAVQEQAAKAYELWQDDPYHPSLQFKRVSQKQPIYSARVNLNYRVLGLLESEHIYWYWIGAHNEYDELLKQM